MCSTHNPLSPPCSLHAFANGSLVPPFTDSITLQVADVLLNNKTYSVNYMGDSNSKEMIPTMINWWRKGKLPLERLVQYFKAEDFEKGLHGMHDGSVIKPVLLWE